MGFRVYLFQMSSGNFIQEQRQQRSNHILDQLRVILPSILTEHPVEAAYVFGSIARGVATPMSDVDIALLLSNPLPAYDRLNLELDIQGEVEDQAGLDSVDVRSLNEAPLMVKGRIIQQGILVYERDKTARVAFEVATRKRYFDFAPIARRLQDAFLEHVHREGILRGRS
jgi:predicted nucleotidyltransferase